MTAKEKALTRGGPGWVNAVIRANLAPHRAPVRRATVVLPPSAPILPRPLPFRLWVLQRKGAP